MGSVCERFSGCTLCKLDYQHGMLEGVEHELIECWFSFYCVIKVVDITGILNLPTSDTFPIFIKVTGKFNWLSEDSENLYYFDKMRISFQLYRNLRHFQLRLYKPFNEAM